MTFSVINEVCNLVSIGLNQPISFPSKKITLEYGLHILSTPMGFMPYVESFHIRGVPRGLQHNC